MRPASSRTRWQRSSSRSYRVGGVEMGHHHQDVNPTSLPGSYQDAGTQVQQAQEAAMQQALRQAMASPDPMAAIKALMQGAQQGRASGTAQVNSQAQTLAQNVDTRQAPTVGGQNYLNYSHDALYGMVNTNLNAGQVGDGSQAWNKISNSMVTTSESAQLVSDNMYNQSTAAQTAQSAVPKPVPYSFTNELNDFFSAPNPVAGMNTINQKLAAQQQAHQAAANAVQAYDTTLGQSAGKMPAMAPVPTFSPTSGGGVSGGGGGTGSGGTGGGGGSTF